jgi:hypothetical protein
MNEDILIILGLIIFFVLSYFLVRFVSRQTHHLNNYLRLSIVSFLYALFFGIGLAASGGEPGFALPAPNLVAILLMLSDGLYNSVISGLIILLFWWTFILLFMLARHLIRKRKQTTGNV